MGHGDGRSPAYLVYTLPSAKCVLIDPGASSSARSYASVASAFRCAFCIATPCSYSCCEDRAAADDDDDGDVAAAPTTHTHSHRCDRIGLPVPAVRGRARSKMGMGKKSSVLVPALFGVARCMSVQCYCLET